MQVTKAHRQADTTADLQSFRFDGAGVNLLDHDVIWLIGFDGRNSTSMSGTSGAGLSDAELAAIARFMDAGGGVFATGDHDSIGAEMSGHIPRVRAARCWYGEADSASPMPAGFPRNFPPITSARADTTRPNPGGDYSEFAAPFIWFENQSDSVPQAITPTTTPAHPILRRNGNNVVVYPDHMHEGQTLGEVAGYDYTQTITLAGETFTEFPIVAGEHPKPRIIATGEVLGFQNRDATSGAFVGGNDAISAPKNVNTLSVYDGHRVGVGRIVTGATFHHYVDINLTGDTDINTAPRKARTGADAEKGHGFAHPGAEEVFADIKAVFVNITNWLARPRPTISLILERSTFGEDEVTASSQFNAAILVTVDGLKPSQFPGGGITTLSPSGAQLASWAPTVTPTGVSAIEIVPTSVSSDDPTLPARLQRFTFTYRVRFVANAFGFAGPSQVVPVQATLTSPAAPAALNDNAWIQLVKSANPFMLDLDGGNTTTWLSSDLKVFRVVAGETVHGQTLPDSATRAQALQFIRNLTNSISVGQFEALSGNQSASALSPFPITSTGKPVYNFAVARVRRNGTMAAANDVRVFFRIFTSQTTAALTYREAMGAPIEGYRKTAGATPIALPGVTSDGNEWLSFPFFSKVRAASPNVQDDPDNVKTITVAQNDKFFGALIDNNLPGSYLPPTPVSAGAGTSLPTLLMGEHQCLVAQVEFAGTPIPSGANPATSDKLAQRNIALSAVANPGVNASRIAMHTFEIEATPHLISDELRPDELLLEWSRDVPDDTYVRIHIPSWNAEEVVALADRFYPCHDVRAVDAHTIEVAGGGMRYVPIPKSLQRQTGVLSAELPLGIKKGQRFDVSVRQITNRSRNVKVPQPKSKRISLQEAEKLIAELGAANDRRGANADGNGTRKRGVFDLGNNRSLVTDLSVFDAVSDHALIIEHPDPKEVEAARRASGLWRETVGAFQLGIPVSTKDEMLLHHLRLLSVMTWRGAKLSRKSRWHAAFTHYVELIADKVRALGGDPFAVPATPDGMIPQLPGKDGNHPDGGGVGTDTGGTGGAGNPGGTGDPYFEPQADDWLSEMTGQEAQGTAKPGMLSGKISGLLYDHFGDFEGFTLETYGGAQCRYFSRETAILELARTAWLERYVVTVITPAATSQRVRRLLIRGYSD
ncbi:MAG: hypothetical protein SFV15_26165 [Polyangiaceae bacterium]|nr:hypothetical protein [Polyangiaceae bacterium]